MWAAAIIACSVYASPDMYQGGKPPMCAPVSGPSGGFRSLADCLVWLDETTYRMPRLSGRTPAAAGCRVRG